MSLLSSSASITPYRVETVDSDNILQLVRNGLKKHTIQEIDGESAEKTSGWVSIDNPFATDFEKDDFQIGSVFVFGLRIDKKNLPAKLVKKHLVQETAKRLAESGREKLARNELKTLKENIIHLLVRRIPATPHIYHLVWNVEAATVWFLSNLKSANEELENLFYQSFQSRLIRLFPYTTALFGADLSDVQIDQLNALAPTFFTE